MSLKTLFGFKVAAKLSGIPQKHPIAVMDEPERETPTPGYSELAQRAGFANWRQAIEGSTQEKDARDFRRFLAAEGICVFETEKVFAYLLKIRPEGKEIIFHRVNASGFMQLMKYVGLTPLMTALSDLARTCYAKPIPEPVLMTMATIRERYPRADFFVSDFVDVPKGDPFLAVRYADQFFIIERWDEPGFRM